MPTPPDDEINKNLVWKICGVAAFVWGLTAVVAFALLACSDSESSAKVGYFGDFFGALNCLFSSLAVAGAVFAVILQQKAFRLSQESDRSAALNQQKYESYQNSAIAVQGLGVVLSSQIAKREHIQRERLRLKVEEADYQKRAIQSLTTNEEFLDKLKSFDDEIALINDAIDVIEDEIHSLAGLIQKQVRI